MQKVTMTDNKDITPVQEDKTKPLKEKFIEYFKQLPSQKLAAAYIGRNEDTISRWKGEDQEFADQIEMAKAEWALKNVRSVRSKEWLLERMLRDTFKPPTQNTDVTSGGKPIPILGGMTNVYSNNVDQETSKTR